jgi:hypothetical protein
MPNPEDIRMAGRRDLLVKEIVEIFARSEPHRSTAEYPHGSCTVQQYLDLHRAIAHFTIEVLKEEIQRAS